jgi:hypothetical protein
MGMLPPEKIIPYTALKTPQIERIYHLSIIRTGAFYIKNKQFPYS